jgi:transposase
VAEACRPPADVLIPTTHWSTPLLGEHLRSIQIQVSDSSVRRILHDADLQPHRQKMWMTSQDEAFRDKRDEVLRVYYDSPQTEHILCLDEKTGMQALERRYPDLPMGQGQPVRREYEYIRHGTLTLMGAYDVRQGKLFGFTAETHNSDTFLQLLELVDACYPTGSGHIILDNLSTHTTDEVLEWFEEHPRWQMHFTPKHASWMNQIECAFSGLQRRVLQRGSFASKEELRDKLYQYMWWHNERGQPFEWSYRPKSWSANPAPNSGARH